MNETYNIALQIQYDGTDYLGWQVQNNRNTNPKTIQGTIEAVISKILNSETKIIAAGRTDTGVHANMQLANFHTNKKLDLYKFKHAINSLLNHDIRIVKIKEVDTDFHSRYSCIKREYVYNILNDDICSPFEYRYLHHVKFPIDVNTMQEALNKIIGTYDFRPLSAKVEDDYNTIRTISDIRVSKLNNQNLITIRLIADGFLRKMVRMIIGATIGLIKNKYSTSGLLEILNEDKNPYYFSAAPAKGLFLDKVWYNDHLPGV